MTISLNLIFHLFFPQGTCTSLRGTIYGSLTVNLMGPQEQPFHLVWAEFRPRVDSLGHRTHSE